MENAEEIFQVLDDFAKRKPKVIPRELEEYLAQVARTGDPVYQWPLVRCLFKEKLLNVITEFHETSPGLDIPPCPNVDPFNYDAMKNGLLERLDTFSAAPYTVQRICELLTAPRKQYNRIDKFMRAIEKNVLVVSTREPGPQRHVDQENGDQADPIMNGSDNTSDYSVDVEMEDISWKDNLATATTHQVPHPQPGSSDGHISVDDIQARLQAKEEMPPDTENKSTKLYESVTPPEINICTDETMPPNVENEVSQSKDTPMDEEKDRNEAVETPASPSKLANEEDKTEPVATTSLVIPEIRIHDVEVTQQIINKEVDGASENKITEKTEQPVTVPSEDVAETSEKSLSSDVTPMTKEDSVERIIDNDSNEAKHIAEVVTSSEESSSSSDNTDGSSNSPKTDIESHIGIQEELSQSGVTEEEKSSKDDIPKSSLVMESPDIAVDDNATQITLKSDDYSITDVKSELTQPTSQLPEETKEQADSTKTEEDDNKEIEPEIPLTKDEEQIKEDIKEADSTVES